MCAFIIIFTCICLQLILTHLRASFKIDAQYMSTTWAPVCAGSTVGSKRIEDSGTPMSASVLPFTCVCASILFFQQYMRVRRYLQMHWSVNSVLSVHPTLSSCIQNPVPVLGKMRRNRVNGRFAMQVCCKGVDMLGNWWLALFIIASFGILVVCFMFGFIRRMDRLPPRGCGPSHHCQAGQLVFCDSLKAAVMPIALPLLFFLFFFFPVFISFSFILCFPFSAFYFYLVRKIGDNCSFFPARRMLESH